MNDISINGCLYLVSELLSYGYKNNKEEGISEQEEDGDDSEYEESE